MRLIDYRKKVLGEVIQETGWRLPLASAIDVARIVFDAGAKPQFANHLQVKCGSHLDALGLE